MPVTTKAKQTKPNDTKKLLAEIKRLKAENQHLSAALTSIQTTQTRKMNSDWMTLEKARQIGSNIEVTIAHVFGDLTKAEYRKELKQVGP